MGRGDGKQTGGDRQDAPRTPRPNRMDTGSTIAPVKTTREVQSGAACAGHVTPHTLRGSPLGGIEDSFKG